jgi:hypothetical protein
MILILLILFYLALSIRDNHLFQTNQLSVNTKAKQLCESTATTIDKVGLGGKGTQATIDIPFKLDSSDYTMHFSPEKTISMITQHGNVFCTFKASVESESASSFDLGKGGHTLYNSGEVVEIK